MTDIRVSPRVTSTMAIGKLSQNTFVLAQRNSGRGQLVDRLPAQVNVLVFAGNSVGQNHGSVERTGLEEIGARDAPALHRGLFSIGQLLDVHLKKRIGQLDGIGRVERIVRYFRGPDPKLRTPKPLIAVDRKVRVSMIVTAEVTKSESARPTGR